MWSDKETERDCLGYSSYVNVLAEVCTHKELAPLTLGTFGSWGSGKTSLMRMLKRRIDETGGEKTVTLWFNAWRYEGRDEAQSALIHTILARLKEKTKAWDHVKDLASKLLKGASVLKLGKVIAKSTLTMTPDLDGLLALFESESEKMADTMESFEATFEELLEKIHVERIVVFIDDLDRCSSAKVIETFETIKLFLNTPACTFVIGADPAKIEEAVGEIYSVPDSSRRKDYLEKIIQIPFTIPEQGLKDIACYVGMLIVGRHLDDGGWEVLVKERPAFYATANISEAFLGWPAQHTALIGAETDSVVEELRAVLPYVNILGRGLRGNPRQIKRFLNILALRRRLAHENSLDIKQDFLIKLGVLEYVWTDFFNAVVETLDPETGGSTLIGEMLKASQDGTTKPSESRLVAESLGRPGLVQFLLDEPQLSDAVDLRPYLFLAQTSLSRGRAPVLEPIEQKARSLISAIESDDSLRAKVAAKLTAMGEPSLVSAVIRGLVDELVASKDAVARTRIITGMDTIAFAQREQYGTVVEALSKIDPDNDAVAVAATTLLGNAESAGVGIPQELKVKFTKASRIAEALARPTKRHREN